MRRAAIGRLGRALRRPRGAAAAALALAALATLLAAGLRPPPAAELLADPGSAPGRATRELERRFGSEPVVVALRGELGSVVLAPANLLALVRLEGRIARLPGVARVFGPGTFVNTTIVQIERVIADELGPVARRADRAARAARAAALDRGATAAAAGRAGKAARLRALGPLRKDYGALLVRFGSIGPPSLLNRSFAAALVFGPGTEPKPRVRWLFPDSSHAVIAVRLRPGLADADVRALGRRLERLVGGARLDGIHATVGGTPLVAAALGGDLRHELARVAPIALALMALALVLALGATLRAPLLLGLAALAAVTTAAAARLTGLGLSPATVAALPVVLGLALDYGVQLEARFRSFAATGLDRRAAARGALRAVGPVLLLAGGAMTAGFAMLTLSPVPLLADLGLTLALGTVVSLVLTLGLGPALLAGGGRPRSRRTWAVRRPPLPRLPGRLAAAVWGVVAGCALAGLVLSPSTPVESDVARLSRDGSPEARQVRALQDELGSAGQLRIAVRADDVTRPDVLIWMAHVQRRIGALDPRLRPGPNPAEIVTGGTGERLSRADVDRLLRLVPAYLTSAVFSPDRRLAELSVGLPLVPVAAQARLVARVERVLQHAPPGVEATPAGLVAAAAGGISGLDAGRPWLLLAALAAIYLVLLAARRDPVAAGVPIVPAVLAAGLAALAVRAGGLTLSPLSAALEPLVLAVGVEFGLLLDARYREARKAGLGPRSARAEAVRRAGVPVGVSALAVALGFLALAAARLELLREFGLLAALEVVLCALLAVVLVPRLAVLCEPRSRSRRTARSSSPSAGPPPTGGPPAAPRALAG